MCFDGFDLKDANNACEQIGLKYVEGAALFVRPAPGPCKPVGAAKGNRGHRESSFFGWQQCTLRDIERSKTVSTGKRLPASATDGGRTDLDCGCAGGRSSRRASSRWP